MKLCKDCKYYAPDLSWGTEERQKVNARCTQPGVVDPVNGMGIARCDSRRGFFGGCGRSAKQFEAKE